ncbi:MAG TPA: hypothetical protein VIN67_04945 [Desulfobaccales bacterium]
MSEEKAAQPKGEVIKPCSRAFFVYYVAIAILLFGPRINPDIRIFGVFHFSLAVGTVMGLLVIALVVYMKWGREYRITPRGLVTNWRWPSPRQQEITWENLGEVLVRRGLTQSMLWVGNLLIKDKSGGTEMFWFGLANPKEIKDDIERRRP